MTEGVLHGLAVIVTGAGQGLGRAYAIDAARHGASVVVNDVDVSLAEAVAAEIAAAGGTAVAAGGSVAEWADAEALAGLAVDRWGRLDGLVNNAGLYHLARAEEDEEAHIRSQVEVNVVGPMFCGVHAIRRMLECGNGGSIINITSGYQSGVQAGGTYGATKGAMASLTYSWALEHHRSGIRVNAIAPLARTRQTDHTLERLRRTGEPSAPPSSNQPESIAPLVTFLLSPAAAHLTGQVIRFDSRRLAIVGHPGTLHGAVERDGWTLELVEEALTTTLKDALQPVGLNPVRLAE